MAAAEPTTKTFPEEALQHVLSFVLSHSDRNSVSLVSKSWYDIEGRCRALVSITNCYAVSPQTLIQRFPAVRSITIKGKHFTGGYDFIPDGWGAHALPWIQAMASAYPALHKIHLRRMAVNDEALELIGTNLHGLTDLVLSRCEGFSTHGLASVAANCRNLRRLDLFESEVRDVGVDWMASFPDSYNSMEFLNVDCLKSDLHFPSLDWLVEKCPNIKSLGLNHSFPLEKLLNLLLKTPHLIHLGIGSFTAEPCLEVHRNLVHVFAGYKGRLTSLSGLCLATPYYLPTIYPICPGLTYLDLTHSTLRCPDLVKLLRHCVNLQRLWLLDFIEDPGLEEVAASCKKLQELQVDFSNPYDLDPNISLTERGVVAVAMGCPKLHSIRYYCSRMTNAALTTIAKHMAESLLRFNITVFEPQLPDYLTQEPLDGGYSAILERCQNLNFLSITGLVTDRLLEHIGAHGKKLKLLVFVFSGCSDVGLNHVLLGCTSLVELGVICSPFSGQALLANTDKLEKMRCIWMASCGVSYRECILLAKLHPRFNVEVIHEKGHVHISTSNECHVENLYMYRTTIGPRMDMPTYVWNAKKA